MKLNFQRIKVTGIITAFAGIFSILGVSLKDLIIPESNNAPKVIEKPADPQAFGIDKPVDKPKHIEPKEVIVVKEVKKSSDYFNSNEVLPSNKATALLIKSNGKLHKNLQYEISMSLLERDIYSSTTLLKNSETYYDDFFDANPGWLSEINIDKNTPAYIVGEVNENIVNSSANNKISIVSLGFTGKFVNTKSKRIKPISITCEHSSFNKEDAFRNVYKEMSDSIASLANLFMSN